MARNPASGPVIISVLDRLIDNDPKRREEVPLTRAQSVHQLKVALRRDIEWLLNTRRTIDPAPDSARETVRSVFHYGFVDISSRSALSGDDQSDLAREMESAISMFERRLKRARVRMEPVGDNKSNLRFVIEGMLCMNPAPEPVRFDAVLELSKGEYDVKGEDGAR